MLMLFELYDFSRNLYIDMIVELDILFYSNCSSNVVIVLLQNSQIMVTIDTFYSTTAFLLRYSLGEIFTCLRNKRLK